MAVTATAAAFAPRAITRAPAPIVADTVFVAVLSTFVPAPAAAMPMPASMFASAMDTLTATAVPVIRRSVPATFAPSATTVTRPKASTSAAVIEAVTAVLSVLVARPMSMVSETETPLDEAARPSDAASTMAMRVERPAACTATSPVSAVTAVAAPSIVAGHRPADGVVRDRAGEAERDGDAARGGLEADRHGDGEGVGEHRLGGVDHHGAARRPGIRRRCRRTWSAGRRC